MLIAKTNNKVTTNYKNTADTGLLTNYLSLVPTRYKLGLVKTVAYIYKINSTWTGFHIDTEGTKLSLQRNFFHLS